MGFHRRGFAAVRSLTVLSLAAGALCAVGVTGVAYADSAVFVVNTAGNADDSVIDGSCDTDPAPGLQCTLRAALQEANANPGTDTIQFALPAPYTITLTADGLPAITDPVLIDGTSLPGYDPSAGTIVRIDGSADTTQYSADFDLAAGASGTTISGLEIENAASYGVHATDVDDLTVSDNVISGNGTAGPADQVRVDGGDSDTFSGNIIGLAADGSTPITGGYIGLQLQETTNAVVDGNTISNNSQVGLETYGADGLTVSNNKIGTDASGTLARANQTGAVIWHSSNVTLGTPTAGNVIAANTQFGVEADASQDSSIQDNTIADNGAAGAFISPDSEGIQIRGNSIHDNAELGIDLNGDGVTPNDPGDTDTGGNGLQNFPVLTDSSSDQSGTQVSGTLDSQADQQYAIDFYANGSCDGSGYGEGQSYLGSTTVTTNDSGSADFDASVPGPAPAGSVITATATAMATGDTSEFSQCVTDQGGWSPTVSITGVRPVTEPDAGSVTQTFTVQLSAPSSLPVSVHIETVAGSATENVDYVGAASELTFEPGQTTKSFDVAVLGDTVDEFSEKYSARLDSPTNATIGTGSRTATIIDNDPPPSVSIDDVTAPEGNRGITAFRFTVSLSTASQRHVRVGVTLTDGTATAPSDFVARRPVVLYFRSGQTSAQYVVQVKGDRVSEPDETFSVDLDPGTTRNATIADGTGVGTIQNDD